VIDTTEYKLFCENNQTYTFPTDIIVSEDFKDFFTQMFLEDPVQRISLAGIEAHPWMTNKDLPSDKEVNDEILRLS
jgi:serine/threonine protein kinase